MPTLYVNGAQLYYEDTGGGPDTIVFAHGLLWSGAMFERQVAALRDRYRCITFDFRGQGRSEVTRDGYDLDTLADDARALITELGVGPCHFAGLSMGGFVALRLALRSPELLRSIILMDTSAEGEPAENVPRYRRLNFVARWFGLRWVASRVMPILFGQTYLQDPARAEEREHWRQQLTANDRIGISRAVRGVIERPSLDEAIGAIRSPTLILVGAEDTATEPERSRRMHERIPGSELVVIPRAGHSATIEEPEAVTEAIADFLARLRPRGEPRVEQREPDPIPPMPGV